MLHEKSATILENVRNLPDTINLPNFDLNSNSSYHEMSRELNRSRSSLKGAPRVAEKVTMSSYMRNPDVHVRNLSPQQMSKLNQIRI